MINKNIVKQPKSLVEVIVDVPWVDLEPIWNATLTKLSADVELSGFRKGMAPQPMVEQSLGGKLQDEAFKVAMPQFLIEALKGSDIVPIDYPKYQIISFVKGTQLQYKAIITNRPQVSIGNYKTIKAVKPAMKSISEEEITKVVEDLFKRWQSRQSAGLTSPVSTKQPQNSTNGQGGSISFQQPTPAAVPTNVSKSADDFFAKAMGAKNLLDLRNQIKKDLETNATSNNELDYEEAILQEVEKITTVEIPEVLIQDELNRMLVSLQRRVADMGLLLEDYLKGQGKTIEQLKTEWQPQAEKNVRMELGLAEIARMENVVVLDQELQAEIDKIQDAKIKQQFEYQEPRLQLRHALRQTRTLDLLKKLTGV